MGSCINDGIPYWYLISKCPLQFYWDKEWAEGFHYSEPLQYDGLHWGIRFWKFGIYIGDRAL